MTKLAALIATASLPLLLAGCTASTVNREATDSQSSSVSSEEITVESTTDTGAVLVDVDTMTDDTTASDEALEDPLDFARD